MSRLKEFTVRERAYFIWAVCLSVVGSFMLIASLYLKPRGVVDYSVVSAAGTLFVFSGSIVGIRGSFDGKLIRFEKELTERMQRQKEKDETEQNEQNEKEEV